MTLFHAALLCAIDDPFAQHPRLV